MNLLKRSIAPVTDEAWEEIDSEASRVLKSQLSARTLVDLDGPHDWELAAINLGRLALPKKQPREGVHWGLREVLPLIEVRVPFRLNQLEIDTITRGSADADLDALSEAARTIAHFEDDAVFNGFAGGNIRGVVSASAHEPLALPAEPGALPEAVGRAVKAMHAAGVGGPYALVLGDESYFHLMQSSRGGYPPRRLIENMTGGKILWSPALEGGVLLSTRGGDFEMTVGQDIALGYAGHDRDEVELYLTESFTFRVLEPHAAVGFVQK